MTYHDLDAWICPNCGRTNTYHPSKCSFCKKDRLEDGKTSGIAPSSEPKFDIAPPAWFEEEEKADPRIRWAALILPAVSAVAWLFLVWRYHKWDAQWGPFPVLCIAPLAAAAVGFWFSLRRWYRDSTAPAGWRWILIPAAGFILCAGLGITFTEPLERGGSLTRSDSRDYSYNYSTSRIGQYYFFDAMFGLGDVVDDVDVDDGEGCLIVLLVLLVVALILGSFFVPHFWTLATFVLLVIMGLVAYREWRLLRPTTVTSLR